MQFPVDILVTALLTGAALAAQHYALYRRPRRLSRPAAFVVGTVTIYTGLTLWLATQGPMVAPWRVVAALSLIIGMAGVVVLVAYAWRKQTLRQKIQDAAIQQAMREVVDGHQAD